MADAFSNYFRVFPEASALLSYIWQDQGHPAWYYRKRLVKTDKILTDSEFQKHLTKLTRNGAFKRGARVKNTNKQTGELQGQRIYILSNGALSFISKTTMDCRGAYARIKGAQSVCNNPEIPDSSNYSEKPNSSNSG